MSRLSLAFMPKIAGSIPLERGIMRYLGSIIMSLFALALTACGNNKIDVSALPQFRYFVESKFTGQVENTLVVEGTGVEQMTFKLSGHGFSADVPLDQEIPVKSRTKLQYSEVGDYIVKIQFFKADGTPLLQDSLKWSFSLESPDNPIVGFESLATNDSRVVLLVSESRDPLTDEIWIEGDLSAEENPKGAWRTIPSTSKVPLRLSEADGNKVLKVKLRNSFKNETDLKTIQILKKTQAPTNCRFEVRGAGTVNRYFELFLAADNDGPVYFRAFGDVVEPAGFQQFTGSGARVPLKLTADAGEKKFTIQIRDAAENYCLREDVKVISDPSYVSEGINVKDSRTWSDSNEVIVQPWIDHFADDTIEMYVHGDINADENTFQWIPWKPELTVNLQPSDGNRWVRVQFRINGLLTSFRYTPVYLKPNVLIQVGTDTPYRIVVANMIDLDKVTITGCVETYQMVTFSAGYKCTASAAAVSVQYFLKNGSTLTKTANFSP